jgi:HlyD family secretion protein
MKKQIVIIILLTLSLLACNDKKEKEIITEESTKKPETETNINEVVGIGRVVPEKQIIQLAAEVNGVLTKIYKEENQTVVAGEVIATLSNSVENAQLSEAQSRTNIQQQQVLIAEASSIENNARLNNAENELARLKNLYSKGAETKQKVENAETEYKSIKATISRLKAQVDGAKSQLTESKSSMALVKSRLEQTKIKAPYSGKILEWKIRQGEGVTALQAIAQIAPAGNTIVESEIDESLANRVKNGQTVNIKYMGANEVIAKGTIYFVSDYLKKKSLFSEESGEVEDRRVRVVKILLDNPKDVLLNSRVEVFISLNK